MNTATLLRRLLSLILLACAIWIFSSQLPKTNFAQNYPSSTAIYARHGELLRLSLAKDQQYRLWLPLQQIPLSLQQATILYEDQHYYRHFGVNPIALLRSAWETYVHHAHQGGSTISMQLAREYYAIDSRSLWGKCKQILAASWLEFRHSKAELLEAYLNLAPYGGNIVGAAAASLLYFHKPVSQLTLAEALTLAVIPQNPRKRNPSKALPTLPTELILARSRLWQRWLALHPEDQRFANDLQLAIKVYARADKPFIAPHLTQYLLQQHPGNSHIYSSLDYATQLSIKQSLDHYRQQQRGAGIRNAAALLVDTDSMQVRAYLGSANYWDRAIDGQVNGVQAKRSPGSTLKPFIYALAIQQGLIHAQSILADTPAIFGTFVPENFDNRFLGPLSAQEALIRSRNIPALNLAVQLKPINLYGFLQQAEVKDLLAESHYGISIALGGAEVSMAELAQLYALFNNQGQWRALNYSNAPELLTVETGRKSLLSPASAFMVREMLAHNPRPDNRRPATPLVAWKTGTSWGFKDAWAVGVFGHYVLAVWVGNFDNAGNTEFVGIRSAAPLLFTLIDSLRAQQLLPGMDSTAADQAPKSVTQVQVCSASGDLPNADCPNLISTWFIPGVSPIKISTLHKKVYFDIQSHAVVCKGEPNSRSEVFEFWPEDMAKLFEEAGLPRRHPPPLPACYQKYNSNASLYIISPTLAGIYTLSQSPPQSLALRAKSNTSTELFWFVDKSFIGKSKITEALSWTPQKPGEYQLTVADAQGTAVSRSVQVAFRP